MALILIHSLSLSLTLTPQFYFSGSSVPFKSVAVYHSMRVFTQDLPIYLHHHLIETTFTFGNFLKQTGPIPCEPFKQDFFFFFKQSTSKDTNVLGMPQEQMIPFFTVESLGSLLSHQPTFPGLSVLLLCFHFLYVCPWRSVPQAAHSSRYKFHLPCLLKNDR